jgi:outer membrane protein OmpA-like peptidoglycan-associated protein
MASPPFPPPDTDPINPPRAPAPREDLDTGVGGFYVPPGSAPDGMSGVYTYDVGDPEREYRDDPNYPIRDPSVHGGNVRVDHSPRDISITTKVTLGHFLGKSTQPLNRIPIDAPERPEELEQITLLRKPDGTTPQILPSKNSETFGGGKNLGASVDQWSYPEGPRGWKGGREDYETPAQIPDIGRIPLSKGFSYPQGSRDASGNRYRNGTDLLSEVEENKIPVKRFMNSFMKNNRFTDESNFNPQSEGDFNPTFDHPTLGRVTAGQLAHVGSILSLRATGDLKPSDGREIGSEIDALIPTPEQIGIAPIPAANFDIAQIIENLPRGEVRETSYVNISGTSYGVLNNVHEHFTGLSSLGMSAVAIANSVTLAVIGVFAFIPYFLVDSSDEKRKASPLDYSLGTSSLVKSDEPLASIKEFIKEDILGFVPTNASFLDATWAGIFAFFAIDGKSDFWTKLGRFAKVQWFNSGQISIVGRAVARSIRSIYDTLARGSNWESLSGISAIFQSVTQNKIIDTLNVFAVIGDAILEKNRYEDRLRQIRSGARGTLLATPAKNFTGLMIEKRRLGWSQKNSAVLLHLNEGIRNNSILLGNSESNVIKKSKERRISTEDKEKFEAKLDSEYVPFYFHDIRTNEIISFHAFLESLTESYTPAVENVEAMGRVEPIKIYKGATRKISFSFYIAAVSYEDFDWMWAKINKLLTLIYPQYTEGRMLEAKERGKTFKFVQPFSQMMSASPMIRLRVGNLIRSNYTDWAMEDMMGANLDDTFLLDENIPDYKNIGVNNVRVGGPIYFDFDKDNIRSNAASVVDAVLKEIQDKISDTRISVTGILFKGWADDRGSVPYNDDLSLRRARTIKNFVLENLNEPKPNFLNAEGGGETSQFDGGKKGEEGYQENRRVEVFISYKDSESTSTLTSDQETKRKAEAAAEARKNRDTLIKQFMDPKGNSIIKTFKDTGAGGGLAGFIESLNLEWINSQTTWDVDPVRKAPKMCKVQIEFAPIHDISPGINAQGNNRAPIYRVSEHKILPFNRGSTFSSSSAEASSSSPSSAPPEPSPPDQPPAPPQPASITEPPTAPAPEPAPPPTPAPAPPSPLPQNDPPVGIFEGGGPTMGTL